MSRALNLAKKVKLKRGTRDYAKKRSEVSLSPPPESLASVGISDRGTETTAAKLNTIVEPVYVIDPVSGKKTNPNNIHRRRRLKVIEVMFKRGEISVDQFNAAEKLSLAWEQTERRPPAIQEAVVDSSPKPDANVAMQIERLSGYHQYARHIPISGRSIIEHVVISDRYITSLPKGSARKEIYLERLRSALSHLSKVTK